MKAQATRDRLLREALIQADPNLTPVASSLRREVEIKNNKTILNFDFAETKDKTQLERLLDVKDAFVAHSLALYITREVATKIGANLPMTYVNNGVFPKSTNFDPDELDGVLYNATMDITIGSLVVSRRTDTLRFRHVPETQGTKNFNILGDLPSEVRQPILGVKDAFDMSKVAQDIEPFLFLSGEIKMVISITLPLFDGVKIESVEPGVKYKAGMILSGMHLESGSKRVIAVAKRLADARKQRIFQR